MAPPHRALLCLLLAAPTRSDHADPLRKALDAGSAAVFLSAPAHGAVLRPAADGSIGLTLSLSAATAKHQADAMRVCVSADPVPAGLDDSDAKAAAAAVRATARGSCFEWDVSAATDPSSSALETGLRVTVGRDPAWYALSAWLELASGARVAEHAIVVYCARPPPPPPPHPSSSARRVGIAWPLGGGVGWGVLGLNLVRALSAHGVLPVPLREVDGFSMPDAERRRLAPSLLAAAALDLASSDGAAANLDFTVLHAVGRWAGPAGSLGAMAEGVRGARNVAIGFFETADWGPDDLAALARYDAVLVGSRWSARVLEAAGLRPPPRLFLQGVDPVDFAAADGDGAPPRADGRFVVFSGGKLEWRKGQDLVVAAVRALSARRPAAKLTLVTAWANPWQASRDTMARSAVVAGPPEVSADGDALLVEPWLRANGVPAAVESVDLGRVPHAAMAAALRAADVALFPNRAEGGTNLVAMEAVATGTLTALSANTGHLDLIERAAGCVLPLWTQPPVPGATAAERGWGESDVGEMADVLEWAMDHPREGREMGRECAGRMAGWGWEGAARAALEA